MIELVLAAFLAFFIAIPLMYGNWKSVSISSIMPDIDKGVKGYETCFESWTIFESKETCASYYSFLYLVPALLLLTMGLTMVIVSYFVDRNNRSAFVNKKVRFTPLLFLFLLLIYTLLTLDCAPSLRSLARLQDKGRPL